MKKYYRWINCGLAGITAILLASQLQAADTIRFSAQPGSVVKIDGTSTIHDWTVEGRIIGGSVEIEKAVLTDETLKSVKSLTAADVNPKVEVIIPIRSLKSGNTIMDGIMYDAMKMTDHPRIEYSLKEMVLKESSESSNGKFKFDTAGILGVSGVKQAIKMEVTMERLENNRLKFTGTIPLKMTNFGIKPPQPKLALGLIKTGDEVKITFEWLTALEEEEE